MEAKKDNLKKYFDDILANLSEQEFDMILEEVNPFSSIGPEVMHYMQYTERWWEEHQLNCNNYYSFETQQDWFNPDSNLPFAA